MMMAPAPDLTLIWLHEGTELFLKALESVDDGALGARILLWPGWMMVANGLVPLNRGGMRSNIVFTTGLELSF